MRRISLIPITILPLLLLSCSDSKGRMRIDAVFKNIDQADLLLYSPDGAFPDIDTIHLNKGHANKTIEMKGGPYTFVVLYPNMQSFSFMASEGQSIKIRADVQQVGQENIMGCDSVLKNQFLQQKLQLSIGQVLPKDSVITHVRKTNKGLIIAFWANWRSESINAIRQLKKAIEEHPDSLVGLSYSLDVDYNLYNAAYREAQTSLVEHCDFKGFQSPLVRKLGINNIPYYLLIDSQGRLQAHGSNYEQDIAPKLKKPAKQN